MFYKPLSKKFNWTILICFLSQISCWITDAKCGLSLEVIKAVELVSFIFLFNSETINLISAFN